MDYTVTRTTHWTREDGTSCVTDTHTASFNINHHVRVRLTEDGLHYWMQVRRDEFNRTSIALTSSDQYANRYFIEDFATEFNCRYVGNGWCEFQMWSLIGLFGGMFHEGMALNSPTPFGTNIILVEQDMQLIETASSA